VFDPDTQTYVGSNDYYTKGGTGTTAEYMSAHPEVLKASMWIYVKDSIPCFVYYKDTLETKRPLSFKQKWNFLGYANNLKGMYVDSRAPGKCSNKLERSYYFDTIAYYLGEQPWVKIGQLDLPIGKGVVIRADDSCGTEEECQTDPDCETDEICESNNCIPEECDPNDNKDCSQGFICDNRRCVSGCQNDNQCEDNEICNNDKLCVEGCRQDRNNGIKDCDPGFVCNNDDICEEGCNNDAPCPANLICVNEECISGCDNDNQCALNEVCNLQTHECEPKEVIEIFKDTFSTFDSAWIKEISPAHGGARIGIIKGARLFIEQFEDLYAHIERPNIWGDNIVLEANLRHGKESGPRSYPYAGVDWGPAVTIYWNVDSWAQIRLTYEHPVRKVLLESSSSSGIQKSISYDALNSNWGWFVVKLELTDTHIAAYQSKTTGGPWILIDKFERKSSQQGPPATIIIGKGRSETHLYLNPDFDNDILNPQSTKEGGFEITTLEIYPEGS